MALFLGNDRIKINLDGVRYCLNLYTPTHIVGRTILLSSDNYILQDSNGIYLIPKESSITNEILLLSSDNYILQDSNGIYLIPKESSITNEILLLSSDNYILQDSNGIYLAIKEE